jgi:nicotinate-nucleotide adenylyltransferase
MQILVFGGTFNPPHLGHQLMVQQVLSRPLSDGKTIDQVWLLPVGQHSFAKNFVAKEHRLAMLELMRQNIVATNPALAGKILLEHYELEREEESQTFATLQALSNQHPEHQLSFLIGSDNLTKFHLWNDYEAMLAKYPFYVYPRQGFDFEPFYAGMTALIGFPQMAVSSTRVRLALEEGQNLEGLLDDSIIAYIKNNQLSF